MSLSLSNVGLTAWSRQLLEDISIDVGAGEILAILGPNGAGKSSLLKVMSGEMPLSSGRCEFLGTAIHEWPLATLAKQLAILPQHSLLSFPFTVEEVVMLGRSPHNTGRQLDKEITEQALLSIDCLEFRDRIYTQLSGGEKQRVQLARVLCQTWPDGESAQCLLLDEPTAALDLSHRAKVMHALRQLCAKGSTIVCVLHDFNLAAQYAQQLVLLDGGRTKAIGTPSEVLTTDNIKDVFGVDVHVQRHPDTGLPVIIPKV